MSTLRRSILLGILCALPGSLYGQADSVIAVSVDGQSVFRVNKDGALVARGALDAGSSPASGAGVRMMWAPHKAAFRAGVALGDAWDDTNLGYWSVAFGQYTMASGFWSTAVGAATLASGGAAFAGGNNAVASGATAFAFGQSVTADEDFAIALGANAYANGHKGVFVWGGWPESGGPTNLNASAAGQFLARAPGGVTFFTEAHLTSGVTVAAGGGSWSSVSDRNRKENFLFPDGETILAKLRSVPVSTWNYRTQDASIRHIGPMAQDFYAAFGLGESDLLINTIDIDGVNLAGVQAVAARTDEQAARIAALEAENAELRARLDRIEALIVKR